MLLSWELPTSAKGFCRSPSVGVTPHLLGATEHLTLEGRAVKRGTGNSKHQGLGTSLARIPQHRKLILSPSPQQATRRLKVTPRTLWGSPRVNHHGGGPTKHLRGSHTTPALWAVSQGSQDSPSSTQPWNCGILKGGESKGVGSLRLPNTPYCSPKLP